MIRFAVVLIAAFLLLSLPPAETQTANTQGFWEELMATFPLGAGGTFIAVQNNETLIHQNFGMVDPESQQAVDNHTVFMGGTLGEIIIAALAMDLVEQGKLNLSKEIVDIIPDLPFDFTTLKRNITLNDLLAHRSGMETIVFGNWVESREGIVDLHEFMKKRLPRVIWEPGTVLSPSSANYALVALALENVTGREFREYAKDTFFDPAGMNNSGFDSDPPSGTVATGVTVHGGIVPQTWVNLYPTHGFYTTPTDLKQLLKQLNTRLGFLLNVSSFEAMENQTSWQFPLPSYGYGLAQEYINGTRMLVKIGETKGFSSAIYMDPERNLTVGMLVNRENAVMFHKAIRIFMKHFFPENIQPVEFPQYKPEGFFSLRRFTGIYRETDFIRSTFEKSLMISMSRTLKQEPLEIGINTMEDKLTSEFTFQDQDFEYIWDQINETVFVQHNSTEFLVFIEVKNQLFIYTSLFGMPQYFEKIPFLQADSTQLGLLIFSEAMFIIGLLAVFMVPRFRKVYLNRRNLFIDRLPYSIMVQGGSMNIIFPPVFNSAIETIPQSQFVLDIPILLKLLLLIPIISVFLFLTFCTYLWVGRKDLGDKKQRAYFLLYAFSYLVYIYVLANLNLLGYQY